MAGKHETVVVRQLLQRAAVAKDRSGLHARGTQEKGRKMRSPGILGGRRRRVAARSCFVETCNRSGCLLTPRRPSAATALALASAAGLVGAGAFCWWRAMAFGARRLAHPRNRLADELL